MSRPPLIVIFGAQVRADGTPSAALARRIACGLAAAAADPDAPILCSGAAGRGPVSEASVITRGLTEGGVRPDRMILDDASRTTIENVEAAARQFAAGGHPHVVACTDAYPRPRVRLLLALRGVPARSWPCPQPPRGHELAMWLREGLAIPYNLVRLIGRRRP